MICAGCSSKEMSKPLFCCFRAPSSRICVLSTVFPAPETPMTIVVDPSKIPPPMSVSIASTPTTDRMVLDVGCDKLVEALGLQQLIQTLIKRMPRRRCQLRVRNPQIFLLLPLLARPHRHAPILRTNPVHSLKVFARESRLAPRAVSVNKGISSQPERNPHKNR